MTAPAPRKASGPDGTEGPTPDGAAPVAVPVPTAAELTTLAAGRWRRALVARASDSALTDVDRLGEAQLDLSAAHPSGIAQLFAGRATRLSNLVREGSALSAAKRRARAVGVLADDHAQRHGLASAFLAIGVATWTEEAVVGSPVGTGTPPDARGRGTSESGAQESGAAQGSPTRRLVRAPVLLRPVAVTPRGRGESDYDLALEPSLEINPVLAAALRGRGALLDPTALARGAFTASGFDPKPALGRLRGLGAAVLDDFGLDDRLLVGTFVHPEQTLVDDLDAQADMLHEHEVLTALAGDERSVAALAHPLPAELGGDRPFEQERGVGNLDAAQAHVLDAVAAGHHLLVDAPSGSDVAGTVAAVVADAAAAGRTVLYVAGHRRAALAVTERLAALGLDDLVLDIAPESDWRSQAARRLLSAMTVEPVDVDTEKVHVVQQELADRRNRLRAYVDGLHVRREPWGASAYDALQALARLTSMRPAPQTTVRLTGPVAESLDAERRAQATADLVRAAGLGAFSAASRATPWYGADLLTPDRARAALRRVEHLLDEGLPRLQAQVAEVAEETGLIEAATPAQWAEQLQMLSGIRGALDVFRPVVFERSAADLIAATATRPWRAEHGIEMSQVMRRRLRKQAKDMLRPGRPVEDLHAALVEVQAQREVWQAHCPAGGWPRIPHGMAGIEAAYRQVHDELDALSQVLAGTSTGGHLADLTWGDLADRLRRLRQDAAALETLPERTALVRSLDRQGLGGLLADLADRRVPTPMVAVELELAWWSTVFEELLQQDPALAGQDGTTLARLVAEFRTLDRRHLADRAVLTRASAREALRRRLRSNPEQSEALFAEIVEERFTSLRQSAERYPQVTRALRPCLVSSPMLVPNLVPAGRTEDLVILDAAGHLPLEVVVSALARGRQVLVVGDTRCASGSALTSLAAVLPSVPLHADTSRRDPYLTAVLTEHGYEGRLTATPLPSAAALLRLDTVEGTGMPSTNGAVEGTPAEIDHVVELVIEHALTRPEESLAVVTASVVHGERVREAVMAEVRDNPALAAFFRPDQPEPFSVTEVGTSQGLTREAIILSVGYGRTPHGRVLHRFGALSEPGGEGRLLEALGATRKRLTVVSCFTADELDRERLRAPGAHLLADLLDLAARRSTMPEGIDRSRPAATGPEPDRLVLDLAERLWRSGLSVDLDHGVPGGPHIPLVVGHPDLPGEMLVAVLTDDPAYVAEPSVRVRDRQRAERLEELGWVVMHVWSAAAFLDPQGEADAVGAVVVEEAGRRRRGRVAPARTTSALARTGDEPAADADRETPGTRSVEAPAAEDAPSSPPAPSPPSPPPAGGLVDRVPRDERSSSSDPAPKVPDRGGDQPALLDLSEIAPPLRPAGPQDVRRVPTGVRAGGRGRGARPAVARGLPISAYSDDELDDLVAWICADGVERTTDELAAALRHELGTVRRGARVDAAVNGAVGRAR